ncbi:MAG: hypothetical protein R3E03_02670 [Novosphingobium sp.]
MLRTSARDEADWLEVVLAGDGDERAYRAMLDAQQIAGIPLVLSEALGRSFGVSNRSCGADRRGGRLASLGLVNSREHLESLFEAKERGVASIQDFLSRRNGGA